MKRSVAFIVAMFFIAFGLNAQSLELPEQEKGDFLMISVHKSSADMGSDAKIMITDGNEVIKSEELYDFLEANDVVKITKWLNDVKDQGYKLAKTNGGGAGGQLRTSITNYLFIKE